VLIIGVAFCLILSSSKAYPKAIVTEKNYYNFTNGIDELSFDVASESINELITTKFALDKKISITASVSWEDDEDLKVAITNLEKLPSRIQKFVKDIFTARVQIVLGGNFEQWVKGYKEHSRKKGVVSYQDPTGLLDRSEITFQESTARLSVIEKKPIGTTRTWYYYKRMNWSRGLKVLDRVSRSVYEGSRAIRSESTLSYKKHGDHWMPKTLTTETTQGVSMNSKDSVERLITEVFEFTNFKIED
jgi:hypothetical protein